MSYSQRPLDIHVHGDVPMRADVTLAQVQEALKPIWSYAGDATFDEGARSSYEEEPGMRWDPDAHALRMCWTVSGDEDFRQVMEEACMSLNDLAERGAAIEVSFYDADFDEESASNSEESRDDFLMCFVGPSPAAILQIQRDMMVNDVVHMMERHFDGAELGGVVMAIDQLFEQRYKALVDATQWGGPSRGFGGGHGPGRKPRHLH
ncbi:MAG: hypothetical protein RL357_1482 [Pseudomonadota bacterium]